MKLRSKIILYVLPPWLISIFIFHALSKSQIEDGLRTSLEQELENIGAFADASIRRVIEGADAELRLLGSIAPFKDLLDLELYRLKDEATLSREQITQSFEDLLKHRDDYVALRFTDASGKILAATATPGVADFDSRPAMSWPLQGTPCQGCTVAVRSPQGASPAMFRLTRPLGGSYRTGELSVDISLARSLEPLKHLKLITRGALAILDPNGLPLYTTGDSLPESRHSAESSLGVTRMLQSLGSQWKMELTIPASQLAISFRRVTQLGYVAFLILLGMVAAVSWFISRSFSLPVEKLTRLMKADPSDPIETPNFQRELRNFGCEFKTIASALEDMLARQQKSHAKLLKAREEASLAEMARQVAHDIRSPLSALTVLAEGGTMGNNDASRRMVRLAIARIQYIANGLLARPQQIPASDEAAVTPGLKTEFIAPIVRALIAEKRFQYRERPELKLVEELDERCYGLCAVLSAGELQRAVSNLVNNAVESMEHGGTIVVRLFPQGPNAVLEIADQGVGISPERLTLLGMPGATFGKKDGHGLGVSHAKEIVESWKGRLEIDSQVGRGTTMRLVLPTCPPPQSFLPSLSLKGVDRVVVVDDDNSMSELWERRFQGTAHSSAKVLYFPSVRELRIWIAQSKGAAGSLYLFDYEFTEEGKNGLDTIEELGIARDAILVTNRYEDTGVQAMSARLGVRIVPKELCAWLPIVA